MNWREKLEKCAKFSQKLNFLYSVSKVCGLFYLHQVGLELKIYLLLKSGCKE